MELSEHERLLDALLADLPKQPHSSPAWAKLDQYEYYYKHHGHLKSLRAASSSKQATCAADIDKAAFQEIQDGAAAPSAAAKADNVALANLKRALKSCRTALRASDAAASDARKLSAALRAKARKSADSELAALLTKRADEVDRAGAHLLTVSDELLTFLAEAELLDDATTDSFLAEQAANAEALIKKAGERRDCLKSIKAAGKP